MNTLDIFSGIGGFSLGLERAGFRTVAFCELDEWCRRVLAKHWPGVPAYDDVQQLDAARLRADGVGPVECICGGFPCQDISTAGAGAGLDGERSGLWREFARLIGELRPRYAIVENVGALRGRGLASVLADLAAIGYDAEWHAIPAAAVGAPHLRDRVWIVAYRTGADSDRASRGRLRPHDPIGGDGIEPMGAGETKPGRLGGTAADADSGRLRIDEQRHARRGDALPHGGQAEPEHDGTARPNTDADSQRRQRSGFEEHGDECGASRPELERLGARGRRGGQTAPKPERERRAQLRGLFGPLARALAAASTPWERTAESPLCGLDDGLPARLARPRLKALGNAVVPKIPEIIGRAILELERDEA